MAVNETQPFGPDHVVGASQQSLTEVKDSPTPVSTAELLERVTVANIPYAMIHIARPAARPADAIFTDH